MKHLTLFLAGSLFGTAFSVGAYEGDWIYMRIHPKSESLRILRRLEELLVYKGPCTKLPAITIKGPGHWEYVPDSLIIHSGSPYEDLERP